MRIWTGQRASLGCPWGLHTVICLILPYMIDHFRPSLISLHVVPTPHYCVFYHTICHCLCSALKYNIQVFASSGSSLFYTRRPVGMGREDNSSNILQRFCRLLRASLVLFFSFSGAQIFRAATRHSSVGLRTVRRPETCLEKQKASLTAGANKNFPLESSKWSTNKKTEDVQGCTVPLL